MAADRYDDDGVDGLNDAKPEQDRQHSGSAEDAPAARAEPAELRTRAEYYETLRAADGRAAPAGDNQDVTSGRQESSGWDGVDAEKRPPLEALHVTPERSEHILDGDATGRGGHRHGVGNPGKTEFPASWADKKIMDNVHDVARRPDQPPIYQDWNSRWLARGTRDDVEVVVVVAGDGRIWSAWPRPGGPGVVRNPRRTDEQV